MNTPHALRAALLGLWLSASLTAACEEANSIKDKAVDKADGLKDKAGDLKDQATDKAGDLKDQAADKVGDLKDKAAELKEKGAQKLDEAAERLPGGKKRGMLSLSPQELEQKAREDLALIARYDEGLQRTLDYAASRPELFPKDGADLTPDQRHELRQIQQSVLDYLRALDATKSYWSGFHHFNLVTEHPNHARSYFVGWAAWLVQYRHGLRFIGMTVPNAVMETLLDEAAPGYDIPAKSFGALKYNIIHVEAVARLLGGEKYYEALKKTVAELFGGDSTASALLTKLDAHYQQSKGELKEKAAVQFTYNAFDIARDATFATWFPVQKEAAEWMGDTKVKRLHDELIDLRQVEEMRQKLEPGDILVARHNWYLSNIGLPGFWPHAELYVGDPEALKGYFDDPEVKAWLQKQPAKADNALDHLAKTYPKVWEVYTQRDADNHPRRVIEAISEGVSLTSLEHAAGCDYVGAMRPRQSKLAKLQAIARAFELYGKPYDFNFDFLTDESLVCTELVYKAWEPAEGKQGPKVELVKVMGRTTLPANDLVRQFDEQYGTEQQQLDFVYFLDGREKAKGALVSDLDGFRASWKRPKWDVLQQ